MRLWNACLPMVLIFCPAVVVAASLRDKLIDMGFTDEEVRQSLRPASVEEDSQGQLFDPDPVAPTGRNPSTLNQTCSNRSIRQPSDPDP